MWYDQLWNVVTLVLSAAVFVFAMVVRSQSDKYHILMDNYIEIIDLLIFFSAVQVIIAVLKCCRLFRSDICSSTTLTVLMATINIIEMCVCVALMRHEHPASVIQQSNLKHVSSNFYKGEVLKDWDTLQLQIECCGIKNYSDWIGRVPESCCEKSDRSIFECTPQIAYEEGCLKKLNDPIIIKDYTTPWEICLILSIVNLIIECLSYYLQRARVSEYLNLI